MSEVRRAARAAGTVAFEGYGDLSLSEILPALLSGRAATEVLIAAPSLPDLAAEAVARCMRRRVAMADGSGNVYAIRRLTVVADLSAGPSPDASAWIKDNPFPGRLVLCDVTQKYTAILFPDFAVTGPVNMRYGQHFTATATDSRDRVEALWRRFADITAQQTEKEEGLRLVR